LKFNDFCTVIICCSATGTYQRAGETHQEPHMVVSLHLVHLLFTYCRHRWCPGLHSSSIVLQWLQAYFFCRIKFSVLLMLSSPPPRSSFKYSCVTLCRGPQLGRLASTIELVILTTFTQAISFEHISVVILRTLCCYSLFIAGVDKKIYDICTITQCPADLGGSLRSVRLQRLVQLLNP